MNVVFEDEDNTNRQVRSKTPAGIAGWLIKSEIALNEKQANIILTIVAIVCLLITVFMVIKLSSSDEIDNKYIYDPAIHD